MARKRRIAAGGKPAVKRMAFLNGSSIAAAATGIITQPVNRAFKPVWLLLSGANQSLLNYNGATIRGIPQEVSAGSIGCAVFDSADTVFFWDYDTVNPGDTFQLSFTNTHVSAVVPSGALLGYAA